MPTAKSFAPQSAIETRRKNGIKAIKACVRQLGIDDATYRTMLASITGKTSATLLSLAEQGAVLDHLKRSGAGTPTAKARDGGRKRVTPPKDKTALMAEIHGWLSEMQRVTGKSYTLKYADAIAKRNGWADAVDFCSPHDLHLVVGALARTARHLGKQATQQQRSQGMV